MGGGVRQACPTWGPAGAGVDPTAGPGVYESVYGLIYTAWVIITIGFRLVAIWAYVNDTMYNTTNTDRTHYHCLIQFEHYLALKWTVYSHILNEFKKSCISTDWKWLRENRCLRSCWYQTKYLQRNVFVKISHDITNTHLLELVEIRTNNSTVISVMFISIQGPSITVIWDLMP